MSSAHALPRISIVTPSFNQGRFIERTVNSVLGQNYENLDYVICDGDSQDSTRNYLDGLTHPRTRVISEPDDGQADAIRKGFAQTDGEIVAWLNSDDILLPGALRRVAEYFARHPAVDVVYSHRVFIDSDDRIRRFWILPPHSNYFMRRWDYIPQETCFWRRRVMDAAGGMDASYQFAMDYDLFERMMRQARFVRLNAFLAGFREHEDAKTTTQIHTVGEQEIWRVRERVGMNGGFTEKLINYLTHRWIMGSSAAYARLLFPLQKQKLTKAIRTAVTRAASTVPR